MKKAIIFLSLISLLSANQAIDTLKSNCIKKWKNDYTMIEYCFNNQVEAYGVVSNLTPSGIITRCKAKWGDDYIMVLYCYENQSKAKRSLGL